MASEAENETAKVLTVKDGKIVCVNGQTLNAYLKVYMKKQGIEEGAFLNIIPRDILIDVFNKAQRYEYLTQKNSKCSFCATLSENNGDIIVTANAGICRECLQEIAEKYID